MLDSVDYLCFTGGTTQIVLCASALGDAGMEPWWTALVRERHGAEGAPRGLPWVTPQGRYEKPWLISLETSRRWMRKRSKK